MSTGSKPLAPPVDVVSEYPELWAAMRDDSGAAPRLLLLAFAAGVFACYLLYTPFDAWWYLRFVLPAFPAIFTLAADAVWLGTKRFGLKLRAAAIVVFVLACMDWGVRLSREQHVLDGPADDPGSVPARGGRRPGCLRGQIQPVAVDGPLLHVSGRHER